MLSMEESMLYDFKQSSVAGTGNGMSGFKSTCKRIRV